MDTAKELKALLEIQEKELGAHHVKVANTLAAIADLLVHQGKLMDAEPLYWRVVEIRHKICGQSNLDVAATLHDLSALYEQLGNEAEAERLLRWSCDIRKKLCGPDSQEYQGTLEQLRRLIGDVELNTDGDLQPPSSVPQPREDFSWDEYFERGVELQEQEQLLASEHLFNCLLAFAKHFAPLTINHARALDHVARTYLFQGRFAESRQHFEQALAIFENTAGTGDVDTVECLEGTADAHASLDEPEQARFLYTWGLAIAQKQNFQEPAERISCKLAALPFVSKNKGVDDQLVDKVMIAAAETKPVAHNKKTGSHVMKPSAADPAVTASGGGLNALLQDLGPAPKKKTVTVIKPQFNQPVAPAASTLDTPATAAVVGAPSTADQVVAASTGEVSQPMPRRKTTTSILKPIAQTVVNPPPVSTPSPSPVESTAEVAAGGLDALLRDIAPRRKKTTSTILKPVFSRPNDGTGEPVLQGTVEAVLPPVVPSPSQPEPPAPSVEQARETLAQSDAAPSVYQYAEPSPPPPTDVEEEARTAAPLPKVKKTSGVQKPGKKTGSMQKGVSETDLSAVRTERALQPPGALRGDISPRNRTPIRPGMADADQPLDSKPVMRIGKGGLDEASRKPIRPWQRPDRPPLEELLLGKSDSGASPTPPKEQPAQPALRQSSILRPKPDERAPLEPDPTVFVPEDPPVNPMIVTMMWEKNMAMAEKQFMLKRHAEAERFYLLALEKAETFGEDDPRLWQTQTQLAQVYEADRKFVRAGHLYRSVLQAVERKHGSHHKDVLMYLERLGELYTVQDRWDEAEGCYQQMLKVYSKAGNHGAMSDIMGKLGIVQRRRGQR